MLLNKNIDNKWLHIYFPYISNNTVSSYYKINILGLIFLTVSQVKNLLICFINIQFTFIYKLIKSFLKIKCHPCALYLILLLLKYLFSFSGKALEQRNVEKELFMFRESSVSMSSGLSPIFYLINFNLSDFI